MKNSLFYARPDTCKKALRATRKSRFPVGGLLNLVEWLEQRKDCGEKIENIMRQPAEIEVPKSIITKEPVNLCDLNDYP